MNIINEKETMIVSGGVNINANKDLRQVSFEINGNEDLFISLSGNSLKFYNDQFIAYSYANDIETEIRFNASIQIFGYDITLSPIANGTKYTVTKL